MDSLAASPILKAHVVDSLAANPILKVHLY